MFIFDKVAHYHIPLFQTLERRLEEDGHSFILLSGKGNKNALGRIGERKRILKNELKYNFSEIYIKNYMLRYGTGVLEKIRNQKPDIVVIPSHVGNILHWKIQSNARKQKYKIISWQCGYEYNNSVIKNVILKFFLKKFDHHLAYHSNAKKYVVDLGIPDDMATIIHNTIDETRIKLSDRLNARQYLFEKYPMLKNHQIILYVGAILKEKNIELIVDALDILKRKKISLVIVGDGPYLKKLQEYCLGRDNILFSGRVIDEVGFYFDAADVFILPGTGGLAINEAMYHGLPIISGYADGSADDLVIHNKNGYRIKEYKSEELSEYISIVLDDNNLRERMGKESKRMITEEYSFENFINIVSSVLNKYDVCK